MGTLQQDATAISGTLASLATAAAATANTTFISAVGDLGDFLSPMLSDPTLVDQTYANTLGAAVRSLDELAAGTEDQTSIDLATSLHSQVSQACVDHFDDTIDWYEAAGASPPKSGGAHTDSGTKTKPDPTPGP